MSVEEHDKWTWGDFLKRFKEKRLGFGDIDPLTVRVCVPFLLVSGAGLLLVDSESDLFRCYEVRLIAIFAFASIVVLFGMLSARAKGPRTSPSNVAWMTIWPPLVAAIWVPMLAGYLLWANALLGEQNKTILSGLVVEKKEGGGRYTGKDYSMTIKADTQLITLNVTSGEYGNYPLGSVYRREMIRGGLGIYYSWGLWAWKG